MSSGTKLGILVVGIGNPVRGDDGVGRVVARHLRERGIPGLRVLEHDGEGTSLMELWKGEQNVIVIDAISSPLKPGTIRRFDAARLIPSQRIFQNSTHAFGLREALQLAQVLHHLPRRLIIYGIAGERFALGENLSAEVDKAALRLVDRILEEVAPSTFA